MQVPRTVRPATAIARAFYRQLRTAGIRRRVPEIMRTLPHDPAAYTQGLACADGLLYESAGGTESTLRCIDLGSGAICRVVPVQGVWAEGIAVDEERITLLTWKHEVALLFSRPDLEPSGTFNYAGEGWGLAASDHGYIMTDGSSRIQLRDRSFQTTATMRVRMNGWPVRHLNDLTIVRDTIYANVWYSTDILEICANTGRVVGLIDCSSLRDFEAPRSEDHVLNGIAYDDTTGAFLVTGKCWRHIFQVRFATA